MKAGRGFSIWPAENIIRDLEEQGGLPNVKVKAKRDNRTQYLGEYQGIHFALSWKQDSLLMLTMFKYLQPLVGAFTKVVGYEPFCQYVQLIGEYQLPVIEWAKNDTEERFRELERKATPGLTKILR